MNQYQITEIMIVVEGEQYRAYGVQWGGRRVDDLTTERQELEEAVNLWNQLGLDADQLEEAVEDFLCGEEGRILIR